MDLKLLREATRPEHEATEAVVPLMQPGQTRSDYISVLQRFHGVVCAWDAVAAAETPQAFAELVRERQRCNSIEADLRFFGTEPEATPPAELEQRIRDLIAFDSGSGAANAKHRFLGAMYVMEGSTLGGQYVASHVEKELHLAPGEGDRYFRGYGRDTLPKWREFQQVLLAVPDGESDVVIQAAKGMFAIFRYWMMQSTTDIP